MPTSNASSVVSPTTQRHRSPPSANNGAASAAEQQRPTRIPQTPPPPLLRSQSLRMRTETHPITTNSTAQTPNPHSDTEGEGEGATARLDCGSGRRVDDDGKRIFEIGHYGICNSWHEPPGHDPVCGSCCGTIAARKKHTNTIRRLSSSKSLTAISESGALDMAQPTNGGGHPTQCNGEPQSVSGGAPSHSHNLQKGGKHSTANGGGHRHHHGGMSLELKSWSPGNDAHLPTQRRASSVHLAYGAPSSLVQSPLTPRSQHSSSGPHSVPARLTPKTPPVSPDDPLTGYQDDDQDSMYSYTSLASGRSTMSCDHACVARNGTTFSGRKMKYVVHCSSHSGQTGDDYLTPTQRAQKHIRRLKMLLSQAHMDLEQRDSEILRLTKEVVELRLFKASLSSPEDRSNSSDAVTVRENDPATSTDVSPIIVDADDTDAVMSKSLSPGNKLPPYAAGINASLLDKMMSSTGEMHSSYADSGHFEDITTSSVHSKDSYVQTSSSPNHDGRDPCSSRSPSVGGAAYDRSDLIKFYEMKIEELIKNHSDESQEVKVTHNDRVEALLQKLAECNSRFADMVPNHEQAKERIRELEKQLEELQQKLQEQEHKQNKMYLHMFTKGQEAERIEHADKVLEMAAASTSSGSAVSRVSVPELLQQLQVTQNELENIKDTNYVQERGSAQALLSAKEAISLWLLGARKTMYRRLIEAQQSQNRVDPEVTLQFLKSAVYYFLTDKENTKGHLSAIESILGFSDKEKRCIDRARPSK